MKKIIASAIASLALVTTAASAAVFVEQGDAGYSALTAQSVANNTTSIQGSLASNDSVDIYAFQWNGGFFSVGTSSSFDPMLHLFASNGTKLAFNDDYNSLQSFIGLNLGAGSYLLSINQYSYNYNGSLAGFANAANHFGPNAGYSLNFNSAVNDVPEPASLGLLAIAALGVGIARRRKQA